MYSFFSAIPRLIIAVIAGIGLFFFATIGLALALGLALVLFVVFFVFMRKNRKNFENGQTIIITRQFGNQTYTNKTSETNHSHTQSLKEDFLDEGPVIDVEALNSSEDPSQKK